MTLGDTSQGFQSNALDEGAWFQDLAQYTMNSYATKGLIPASTGVNKPEAPVADADSFINTVQGWLGQQRAAKGGAATDTLDTAVEDSYRERRFQWLSREEGIRQFAYDDATGQQKIPGSSTKGYTTVGIGFNMDAPGADKRFSAALPGVDFNAVHDGRMNLNDAQTQQLFDRTVAGTEKLVSDTFAGTDLTEHQRLGLVSLGYQRPAAIPEVAEAFKSGGLPGAVVAMLQQPGSQGRRLREISQFLGATDAHDLMQPFIGGKAGGAAAAAEDIKQFLGRPGWDGKVRDYIASGGVGMDPGSAAWCAMMVNSALAHHGIQGTGSQLASSFDQWGAPVSDPSQVQEGDVLVAPGSGVSGRHVGMATGQTRMGGDGLEVEMAFGNGTGHRAGTRFYPAADLNIRRAMSRG